MKKIYVVLVCAVVAFAMSSCNTYRHSMREPNAHVEFHADDFELSEPVTGEATITHVLGIDWEHTFGTSQTATTLKGNELPIIGNMINNSGSAYALYDLMQKHPGYDVIFYPQVESYRHAPILGTSLYSVTTYKVTARLGKMKKK